ncbi:MAG TPA: ATP-binding cassette domain-containing protein, partial [Casimicrobiaceae bacterium]|nr:ATP-binding cassette domain-containing protein [Casimicrobiaceae bacterium]
MNNPVIRIRNLHKRFGDLHVIRGVDLDVARGERIAIIGASGSGKSTILRCVNFMEMPSDGTIELDGKVLGTERRGNAGTPEHRYSEAELCEVRTRVGMVFQQFNLFP